MQQKHAHLEMIQAIINRMATNSFHLKGWSVTLVAALFALAAKDSTPVFVYLAYFPAFAFWLLDGFFLHQEKLFRALYDHVRQLPDDQIDFSMDTKSLKNWRNSWVVSAFSKTLLIFHGAIIGTIFVVIFFALDDA